MPSPTTQAPDTLPAHFDFKNQEARDTLPTDFTFKNQGEPDTLPADFDFGGKKPEAKPALMARIDTTVTNTLAPSPENYESLARTNLIEVPRTLGREVYSAGKTALGMIPGIYHAFADEATSEEKESQAQFERERGEKPGTESTGLKRIGLGIERMTTAPVIEATKAYINPKTRPTYEQTLSVLPEALGQGAGTVVGGKLIENAAEQVPAATRGTISTIGDATKRDLPAIRSTEKPELRSKAETTATGSAPSLARLEEQLNKSLGGKPLKPGVPLREQLTSTAESVAPRTQFEAANGKELNTAISKEFPDEKAANGARSAIHNLSNVELRQLAINLGEDLSQSVISRAKQSGAVPRSEIFKHLLENNSAIDISKAIESGQHLPSQPAGLVRELWSRTEGEAGRPGSVGKPFGKTQSLSRSGRSGDIAKFSIDKSQGRWEITGFPKSWDQYDLQNVFADAQDEANSTGETLSLHVHGHTLETFEPGGIGTEQKVIDFKRKYGGVARWPMEFPEPTAASKEITPLPKRSQEPTTPVAPSGQAVIPPKESSAFSESERPSSITNVRRTQATRQALLEKLKAATEKAERAPWRSKRGHGYKKTKKD